MPVSFLPFILLYPLRFPPPHLLWASVEITGEISVCGRACLSSRGSRGKGGGGGGVEGGRKDWEGEEKEIHALQYCCVVCGTLPFVCLAITYSAQGHSSRGWARASVKTENNEATAAQRIAFSLCLGRPPFPLLPTPTPPPPAPSPPPPSLPLSADLNR